MRIPKNWRQVAKPTEAEVLKYLKTGFEACQIIGMPIAICALPPSNDGVVIHMMVRGSAQNPGVPSAEDATHLASSVLARVLNCYPQEEPRNLLRRVILEVADKLVYEKHAGTIPPHMIESDEAPGFLREDGDPE